MKNREYNEFWQHILDVAREHMMYGRKPSTPTVEQVAETVGAKVVTLYKILEGERPMYLEDLPAYYRAMGRPLDILTAIVRGCEPSAAIILPENKARRVNGSMGDEIEELTVRLGEFIDQKRTALSDHRIDRAEGDSLTRTVVTMMSALEGLLLEIGDATGKEAVR